LAPANGRCRWTASTCAASNASSGTRGPNDPIPFNRRPF
jgi:hypothetical protein